MKKVATSFKRPHSDLRTSLCLFILAVSGLLCGVWPFSSYGEQGLLSSCTSFSPQWLLWLQSTGSGHMGFSNCGLLTVGLCGFQQSCEGA